MNQKGCLKEYVCVDQRLTHIIMKPKRRYVSVNIRRKQAAKGDKHIEKGIQTVIMRND